MTIETKTSKFAAISYFDCRTIEDVKEYPKVCITAEVTIDKAMVHHVDTDKIKSEIEKAVKASVWLYSPTAEKEGGAK